MRRIRILSLAILVASFAIPARAEAQAGTLRGLVTDTTGRPLANVEVVSLNNERSTRTGKDGRFTLTRLPFGQQLLMARAIGYQPIDRAVNMLDDSVPDVTFRMRRVVALIDTVRITSHDGCAAYDFAGFECRRKAGIGVFRGEEEIQALRPFYWADMFEGLPGFRREGFFDPQMGQQNWRVESTTGWRCLMEGWNGRHKQAADELTQPSDIVAIEHYEVYEKVPAAYKRLAWPNGQEKPCALVMYWTRPFLEHQRKR